MFLFGNKFQCFMTLWLEKFSLGCILNWGLDVSTRPPKKIIQLVLIKFCLVLSKRYLISGNFLLFYFYNFFFLANQAKTFLKWFFTSSVFNFFTIDQAQVCMFFTLSSKNKILISRQQFHFTWVKFS